MTTTAKISRLKVQPVPCPRCGATPALQKFRSSYWRVKCDSGKHVLSPVDSTPMKTQAAAVEAWNTEHGKTAAGDAT